jgi:hypothetical protein
MHREIRIGSINVFPTHILLIHYRIPFFKQYAEIHWTSDGQSRAVRGIRGA